jgi:exonuclease SbcD
VRRRGRSYLEIAEEFVVHVRAGAVSDAERDLLARALGAADRAEVGR